MFRHLRIFGVSTRFVFNEERPQSVDVPECGSEACMRHMSAGHPKSNKVACLMKATMRKAAL
jgi:hypothetical protein